MPRITDTTQSAFSSFQILAGSGEGIFRLPAELLVSIFKEMDDPSRIAAGFACREFNLIILPSGSKDDYCKQAAELGYIPLLQWAKENNCPLNERICELAALNGHLKVLKWARNNNCPWNKQTCRAAAYSGHLEILIWLRENDCPWGKQACAVAAASGHLKVFQWLVDNGCSWNRYVCFIMARSNGHQHICKYINPNLHLTSD